MSPRSLLLAVAIVVSSPQAPAADYTQASGSALTFSGSYQGERFAGRFPGFATRLSFDPAQLATARLEVVIPLTTATIGIEDYDGELRGPALLDSATFTQARYSASRFRSLGGDRYAADGTLSLRGVSKPVTLEFSWTPGAHPVLNGKATVQRLAFGVGSGDWADTGILPDDIEVFTRVVFEPLE